jgi:hypothetical protein
LQAHPDIIATMPDGLPKRIYLDTNSLYGWPSPSFTVWNAFRLVRWLKCEICIPAMVERELEGQFLRGIEADRCEIHTRIRNIAKRDSSIIDIEGGVAMADPEEIRAAFQERSQTYKNRFEIRTVPLPNIPIDQLSEMAVSRTPPFEEIVLNADRKLVTGFADTLILLSVIADVEQSQDKDGRFIFISCDKVFSKHEITKLFQKNGLELMANPFALSDNLKPFLTAAIRDPWVKEMEDIKKDLNAQIPFLSQDLFEYLFSSDLIDHLWPNATELDEFRLVSFSSVYTDLPPHECLPPTLESYRRTDGSEVTISTRAEITMTGASEVPNYLSGIFATETDDKGRRIFHATIDVSLTGTAAKGTIGAFQVKGVSR